MIELTVYLDDRTEKFTVKPIDDPCGATINGNFLRVEFDEVAGLAVLDRMNGGPRLRKGASTVFRFGRFRVQADYTS